jgi:proteasome lid subunit RPN8/RPN11
MTARVELPAALVARIHQEATEAAPRECCGLLEGLCEDASRFTVTALHPARNLAADPDKFEIDPRDHIAAAKQARARGRAIIGCYHSHPGGAARPSASDIAGAAEENFLWLIAAGEELGAFVYLRGSVTGADCVTSSGKERNFPS